MQLFGYLSKDNITYVAYRKWKSEVWIFYLVVITSIWYLILASSRKESTGSEVSKETATKYTKATLLLFYLFFFFFYFSKRLGLFVLFWNWKIILKQNYTSSVCKSNLLQTSFSVFCWHVPRLSQMKFFVKCFCFTLIVHQRTSLLNISLC